MKRLWRNACATWRDCRTSPCRSSGGCLSCSGRETATATPDPIARRPEDQVGGRPQHRRHCIADGVSRSRNAPGEPTLHRNEVAARRSVRQCGPEDQEVTSVAGLGRANCCENTEQRFAQFDRHREGALSPRLIILRPGRSMIDRTGREHGRALDPAENAGDSLQCLCRRPAPTPGQGIDIAEAEIRRHGRDQRAPSPFPAVSLLPRANAHRSRYLADAE